MKWLRLKRWWYGVTRNEAAYVLVDAEILSHEVKDQRKRVVDINERKRVL